MFAHRYISKIIVLSILCIVGWYTYTYFFDVTQPCVKVSGIAENEYCCEEVHCCVNSDKTGLCSLWLNNQILVSNGKIKAGDSGYEFIIPTKTLSNGKHVLKIECIDNTYNKNKQSFDYLFFVDNQPLQAVLVKSASQQKVHQGRTLHIQFQVNKEIKQAHVKTLSNEYECFPEAKNSLIYECFIPVECEETPNEYLCTIDVEDKVGNTLTLDNTFQVVAYPFKKEILSVTTQKVQEEKSLGRDGNDLEMEIEILLVQSPRKKLWKGPFCAPIDIERITCEYGTIRTTQHKGRYAHKAVDVVNTPKSVVWAPQDGIIIIKDRFAPSGNTVIIDHGLGIFSLFYHLDSFADIEVGQKIRQGNPIGTIGKTGYATGYHLHWEMRINNIPVDPLQWIKMFS